MPDSADAARRSSTATHSHSRKSSDKSNKSRHSGHHHDRKRSDVRPDPAKGRSRSDAHVHRLRDVRGLEAAGEPVLPPSPTLCRTTSNGEATTSINVVVIGHPAAGATTVIQQMLGLDEFDFEVPAMKTYTTGNALCKVRVFELKLDDVLAPDGLLDWSSAIGVLPIHAVITIFDVTDESSFMRVPDVLNAVDKMGLYSILIACRADAPADDRELDLETIEARAKQLIGRITVARVSEEDPTSYGKVLGTLLKSFPAMAGRNDGQSKMYERRMTLPALPGPPPTRRLPVPTPKPIEPSRQTTSGIAVTVAPIRQSRKRESGTSRSTSMSSRLEDMSSSFLRDESPSERSESQTSGSDQEDECHSKLPPPGRDVQPQSDEHGWSFDGLVDRLLATPRSKLDDKFVAVFLALYRKFSPPGRLLEAIVNRFETTDSACGLALLRLNAQLRYLTIVDTWLRTYPGDFAHPKTLRRIKTFVAKLGQKPVFAMAASELAASIDKVRGDDDTDWAFCDKDRESMEKVCAKSPYRHSLLIDDPDFEACAQIGEVSPKQQIFDFNRGSSESNGKSSSQYERPGERQAARIVPSGRLAFTKYAWRALMQFSHESIAREMTRMDWILFGTIQPRDLIRHVSLSNTQKHECRSLANVNRMAEHFNYLRDWVINYILYRDKAKHRAEMLEKFMLVARKLRELNNYNSLGAVLAGINSVQVHRLQATRDILPAEVSRDCMKLGILMSQSKSYATYRLAWENTSKERIPYMPLQIRDLMGAETGNKTFIGEGPTARINWKKFEVMGEVLVSIQKAQGLPYRSAVLGSQSEDVSNLILHTKITRDDDALYERSCGLEHSTAAIPPHMGQEKKSGGFKDLFRRSPVIS